MGNGYKTEYFQDFDNFKIKELQKKEPVSMTNYGGYKFDFYEMGFSNGCKAFLFNDMPTCESFINYCDLDQKSMKYVGELDGINERVVVESINRKEDFIEECKRLAEGKKYIIFIAPFDLSYEYDPKKELGQLLQNVKK